MKYSNNDKDRKNKEVQNNRTNFSKEFIGKLHDVDNLTEKAYSDL